MIERKFFTLWLYLLCVVSWCICCLVENLVSCTKTSIVMCYFFHILLIVDSQLQSQYTPNDPRTIYLSMDHYMSSNRALNAKEHIKNYSFQVVTSVLGHKEIYTRLAPCYVCGHNFVHIIQGHFPGTLTIVRLPQRPWSSPDEYR